MSTKRKSTSMFIGHTTRGISQPVLFDTHTQIYNNKPPMTLITGSPGSGKDLDINTLIPTPYGFTKMGNLRNGDRVLDRQFRPCRVTFAGEIKERQTYKIKFSDKREIIAGEDHQWAVTIQSAKERNSEKQINLRAKRNKIILAHAEGIKTLQKTADYLFANREWVIVSEFTKYLHKSGVTLWAIDSEIEEIFKRYSILSQKKYETIESTIKKEPTHYYSVYMGLQALYEEAVELSELALFEEKVVTTKELIKLSKNNLVKIRTCNPVDNTDFGNYGHTVINKTSVNNDNNVNNNNQHTMVIPQVNSLSFGTIAERRDELNNLVNELRDEDSLNNLNYMFMETFSCSSIDRLKRMELLAHSLGGNAFISDDSKSVTLETNILDNKNEVEYNWTHIINVKKLDIRKTRCISVDSRDHVYLAGTGFIPTHNTFFAMTITCLSAILGKTTVVLDPKGDFLSLNELSNDLGQISFWALKDTRKAGILDPFYMARGTGEKLNLVIETLSLFLGGMEPEQLQVLAPIIKDVIEEPVPSLLLLTENLLMSERPEARNIGAQLDLISKLPFASLCFAPGSRRQKEISIDEGVTVVTMAGLELSPDSGSPKAGNKARLSSAVFFLITDFIRRFMHDSADTTPKTVIIDEAWAVLATEEGARVIKEIALLARSKNLALVLITQNTSHLDKIDVENTISSRFAFRTDSKEGKTIVENMGLPVGENFEQTLTDLQQGECLMQDWQGRYSTVQISQYNKRWKEAFETNPMEKMRKQKERKAQELARQKREQRRAQKQN